MTTLLESAEGRRMAVEAISYLSPGKYGTGPGSNLQPVDLQSNTYLQSDMLSTALLAPAYHC